MSLVTQLICVSCGSSYAPGQGMICPDCGPDRGILDIEYDLERARETLTRESLRGRTRSHWRYRELLPLDDAFCPTDGHIGWTPLVDAPRLARALGIRRLRLKDDGRNASGSFKDRASSVGVAHALQTGATAVACASTGNAASSLAHCAAAAGLPCNIFVSQIVPEGKLAQLLAYGARVFKIIGTYEQAYDLCNQACEQFGWYNRNAAINPYLVEGKKTGGLEIAEQCADEPTDWVVCSVGDGCSIAGVWKGLRQIHQIGITDWSPRMLGVQADGVAPLTNLWRQRSGWHGRADGTDNAGAPSLSEAGGGGLTNSLATLPAQLEFDISGDTYADSINVPVPRNARKALTALLESQGALINASDDEIRAAVRQTGRLTGIFAEPAAATAVAGIAAAVRDGIIDANADVVACITGNGLKDIAGALTAVGLPHEIPPEMDQVRKIVESEPEA